MVTVAFRHHFSLSPADMLRACQEHLSQETREEFFKLAIRGERALWNIVFERLRSRELTLSDFLEPAERNRRSLELWFGWKLYGAHLPSDHACFLRKIIEVTAVAELPTHLQLEPIGDFNERFRLEAKRNKENSVLIMTTMLFPATEKIVYNSISDKALLRCAITALAAERFRIDTNAWPKSLAELCPKYMTEPLLDPFDGHPLKYAARDDGVTIYSVGADQTDGGAKNLTASGREPGADFGFRLWNVDQRGLPAKAKNDDEKRP